MTESHSEAVRTALAMLDQRRDSVLQAGYEMMNADEGRFYGVDLIAIGAIKRVLSTSSAFKLLIEEWNLVCARTLLRTHIDTALRFSALWLVNNPDDFAFNVIGGAQFNELRDDRGNRLTDRYLVRTRSSKHPWLPDVYKNLSGFVHFSGSHLFASLTTTDSSAKPMQVTLGERDEDYPEQSWVEVINCFNETTEMFLEYLHGWTFTKDNSDIVKKARKNSGREVA